jgi:hypothetical protein
MASKKGKSRTPTQRLISVAQPTGPAAVDAQIDVAKILSQTNHRLYRQSRVYDVSVTIDSNVADGTTVDVYALADTWMVHKALQLAKTSWDESNAEEMKMLHGKVARWNDFRVETGLTGVGGLDAVNFLKGTLAATPFTAGNFENAQVVDQAGQTKVFSWGAPSISRYSIIEEYDASGNTSADPEIPVTGAYNQLLPNLEPGAAAALQSVGSKPPYDRTDIGQAIWVKVGTLHLSTGRQRLSTGFFSAPCGLVVLRGVGWLSDPDIQVEIKSGDYKGVRSYPMLE